MTPTAELSDQTVSRLQKIAIPLTDTYDSVIARLLDFYEKSETAYSDKPGSPVKSDNGVLQFDYKNPPNLKFTNITRITLDGHELEKTDNYWNTMMNRVIISAAKTGWSTESLLETITVNSVTGSKDNGGYTFIPEAGISVQGQDSNGASRQAFKLAEKLGISLSVRFYWHENQKALHPGKIGTMSIPNAV